jgi:DNA segregation ATPase FtsK/SpoIIIE-like protein
MRLEACVNEMERRYDLFREAKRIYGRSAKKLSGFNAMAETSLPRWLVILDEYSDLIESSRDHKQQIESLLKRVSQKARAAGIHLIVATQKPLAEVVNSVVKSNLPAAIALQVKSQGDSRVIIDEGGQSCCRVEVMPFIDRAAVSNEYRLRFTFSSCK